MSVTGQHQFKHDVFGRVKLYRLRCNAIGWDIANFLWLSVVNIPPTVIV